MPSIQSPISENRRIRSGDTILHRLWMWYEDAPDAIIYYSKDSDEKWVPITVEAMVEQVARIAQALKVSGFEPEDKVAIYAHNCPEWVEWELATILAGGISVGVHPNLPTSDLGLIFHEINPKYILCESETYIKKIEGHFPDSAQVFSWEKALEWVKTNSSGFEDSTKTDWGKVFFRLLESMRGGVHFLVYTSGTMGRPRGVQLGLQQLTRSSDMISREWNLPFADGSLFSFLPLAHVAEKLQTLGIALTNRYTVWFNSDFNYVFEELNEVRPTFLLGVPRFWERLKDGVESKRPIFLDGTRFSKLKPSLWMQKKMDSLFYSQVKHALGLEKLKIAVSGAAKLSPAVYEWYQKIGVSISEIYGMSETCGLITMTEYREHRDPTIVGKPPRGIEIKIEKNGEIYVKGDHLFLGYYAQGEADTEMFNGWLKTGDLGELNAQGELKIIGRDREIIKLSNGRMVAPVPIENALKEIPEISNACVLGEGKDGLIALVTLRDKALMEVRFIPGAIEGVTVESPVLKESIWKSIEAFYAQGKIKEKIKKLVILSREFSIEEKEITPTQKINRRRISQNFSYFLADD